MEEAELHEHIGRALALLANVYFIAFVAAAVLTPLSATIPLYVALIVNALALGILVRTLGKSERLRDLAEIREATPIDTEAATAIIALILSSLLSTLTMRPELLLVQVEALINATILYLVMGKVVKRLTKLYGLETTVTVLSRFTSQIYPDMTLTSYIVLIAHLLHGG